MTTAYPPTTHHSNTHLTTSEALSLLTTYLTATTTDPSLHPSAHLTEHGPVAPSSGPNTGLVLHNLRRVEAGLRGENLGDDLSFRRDGEEDERGGEGGAEMRVLPNGGAEEVGEYSFEGQGDMEPGVDGGWQDKAEFERQQDVLQGDVGKRDNAVDGGFEEGAVIPQVKSTWLPGDKEARKKAKKERQRIERLERIAKQQRERDAE
ncbi:hypothetical protein BDR22DRAFT_976943 [Usnea florida]